MGVADYKCPNCGTVMVQTGMLGEKVAYHCKGCGYDRYITLSADQNTEMGMKRALLLNRVSQGIVTDDISQWERLNQELLDFMGHYDSARKDIHMQMAIVACLTSGFRNMDKSIYQKCKLIFKVTERMYKSHCKALKKMGQGCIDNVEQYEEYRKLYKHCRNEYRNTKIMWKIVFSIVKRFVPKI